MQENNTALDAAAKAAITEQAPGSEFKTQVPADAQVLTTELTSIEQSCSALYQKMYGSFKDGGNLLQPPYLERERMNLEIAKLERRASEIRTQLDGYALQMGPMTHEESHD